MWPWEGPLVSVSLYRRSRHSMRGKVVVYRRGFQRLKAGGVPGGVYERSGLLVWIGCSPAIDASTCVPQVAVSGWVRSSSSLDVSHCVELCVAWVWVSGWHCTLRCTLAGLLEVGALNGDSRPGGLQKGEVGRRTRISHVARNPRGGRVLLGGVMSSGVSFHGSGPDDSWLAAGVAACFSVWGGSLAIRS